jgi:hypothetical protein
MSEEAPKTHEISLKNEDCAVIFHEDGTLNVYVPSREEGEPVPPQMLYTILVQEMLKDQYMLKVLTDRVLSAGILGKNVKPATAPEAPDA